MASGGKTSKYAENGRNGKNGKLTMPSSFLKLRMKII